MFIAVDFDGTCVTHSFPQIGKDIGAAPVLKSLTDKGHKLILYTMRSNMKTPLAKVYKGITPDTKGNFLNDAIQWFIDNKIHLYGVQTNPTQSIWTESPKCYAELYIDDAALGAPLKMDLELSNRPFLDWRKVKEILINKEIL